jgi:hypothetical protein
LWQRVQGTAQPYFDRTRQTGTGNIGVRNFRVLRINLQRDHPAVRRQSARQPDCAVAAQRSQFQDVACSLRTRQHMQQLALRGRNADCRESGCYARSKSGFKRWIRFEEKIGDVAVNSGPLLLAHKLDFEQPPRKSFIEESGTIHS